MAARGIAAAADCAGDAFPHPCREGLSAGFQRAGNGHPGAGGHSTAENGRQKRKRGAPHGNQRALRHGKRSGAAVLARKRRAATMKLVRHLFVSLGAVADRCRPSPFRADQLALLSLVDPGALDAARRLGVSI